MVNNDFRRIAPSQYSHFGFGRYTVNTIFSSRSRPIWILPLEVPIRMLFPLSVSPIERAKLTRISRILPRISSSIFRSDMILFLCDIVFTPLKKCDFPPEGVGMFLGPKSLFPSPLYQFPFFRHLAFKRARSFIRQSTLICVHSYISVISRQYLLCRNSTPARLLWQGLRGVSVDLCGIEVRYTCKALT